MKGIGVLPGNHLSYIDHITPLCHILEIPLLVTDPWVKHLIELYYPPLDIILPEPEDYNLDPYLKEYDLFVYVDFFRKGHGTFQFQDYVTTQKARALMSLHGNPDKYWDIYWIENLIDEDLVLVYGPQLNDLLKRKKIPKKAILSGNYRLEYYKSHEEFFDQKVSFQKNKKTVLYAPTWSAEGRLTEHRFHYTPFLKHYRSVFETLSKEYQLIVKLHPHLIKLAPEIVAQMVDEFPQIHFLNDFPLIYPLLKQIDIYLGDYSSIGYDFLYFDRPLFFLETDRETALHQYGERITVEDLPHLNEQSFPRLKGYYEVFGDPKPLPELKREIEYAYRSLAL